MELNLTEEETKHLYHYGAMATALRVHKARPGTTLHQVYAELQRIKTEREK
ncbi:hypothetical protein [Myxococcus phage Mx1]|nr:hypothetical protein [Myxococcus phage Mx1]